MTSIAGVDVGGTFTDVTVTDVATGYTTVAKVLTTANQADGLVRGLVEGGAELTELEAIVHGTTVATNAILERRGAKIALITTAGFGDVLELRRRDRPQTYGLMGSYRPITPRSHCLEIVERVEASGKVLTPIAPDAVDQVVDALVLGEFEAAAVCLLNAYTNPVHEQMLGAELRQRLPDLPISLSHELAPAAGEFERASTVAVNAYVQPKMGQYLGSVREQLAAAGFQREVQVMQSSGGLMPVSRAALEPARTALSGPAAGTVAAAEVAAQAGFDDVISADMGGTSFDVALIPAGAPAVATLTQLDFGIPLRLPMVDIHTIGAGGGSIASVDRGGVLTVGPRSAGADPGPASYGRGGSDATVTDANVILGRLPAGQALGTETGLALDPVAAERAVRAKVAQPLDLELEQAALAIVAVANANMAGAIRNVSVDQGADPRNFALVGYGGAGPLHAIELAREIGCANVIIPPRPGLACALGCLVADARIDLTASVEELVERVSASQIHTVLAEQGREGTRQLQREGFSAEGIVVEHWAEMSYQKQLHTVLVKLGNKSTGWDSTRVTDAFIDAYRSFYGGTLRTAPVRLVNLRTTVKAVREVPRLTMTEEVRRPRMQRRVVFESGPRETVVISRGDLAEGQQIAGPLVIEQTDTTILIPPDAAVHTHSSGSLIVEVQT